MRITVSERYEHFCVAATAAARTSSRYICCRRFLTYWYYYVLTSRLSHKEITRENDAWLIQNDFGRPKLTRHGVENFPEVQAVSVRSGIKIGRIEDATVVVDWTRMRTGGGQVSEPQPLDGVLGFQKSEFDFLPLPSFQALPVGGGTYV